MDKRKKLLVVLDFNGTLLERLKSNQHRVLLSNFSELSDPESVPKPDTSFNKAKFYLRPYLDVFLEEIFSKYKVATWTSAQEKNATFMIDYLFECNANKLVFTYNRSHCLLQSRGPGKKTLSYKLLSSFWKSSRNKMGTWGPHNTILIDDSAYKAEYNQDNVLLLPTFTLLNPHVQYYNDDDALVRILAYLRKYMESDEKDVRKFLKKYPFYRLIDSDEVVDVDDDSDEKNVASRLLSPCFDCLPEHADVPKTRTLFRSARTDSEQRSDKEDKDEEQISSHKSKKIKVN